ncbi:MAG: hypothetical protein VCA34_08305 [Roseibacillus sp.]
MKQRTKTTYCGAALALALIASPGTSRAELSGSISLDLNSHFISYGADVWAGGGDDGWSFNPTLSLGYTLNEQVSFNAGVWMDANSNSVTRGVARSYGVAETDTWIGVAYDAGLVTGSVTLQNWQYGSDSEEILDFGLSVDTFLSPSLTLHKRLSAGGSGGKNGWFAVFNAAHSIDVTEQISVTIPAQIGFALADFHTTDTGYGFANIGVKVSFALTESSSVNVNVKYWDTDGGVTGNGDTNFLTYGVGASFAF